MSESIRNRPKLQLTVRRDTSLTGAPLCPACGQELPAEAKFCGHCGWQRGQPVPPRKVSASAPPGVVITKDRHNQGRGSFFDFILRVVIILILLFLAWLVGLFIHDQYKTAEGGGRAGVTNGVPAFAANCRQLAGRIASPLSSLAPSGEAEITALRQQAAALHGQADRQALVGAVQQFCTEAEKLARERASFLAELKRVDTAPPATLSPNAAEQTRTRTFMREATEQRWTTVVDRHRSALGRAVLEVEKAETDLRAGYRTPWRRLLQRVGAGQSDPLGAAGSAKTACTACRGKGTQPCGDCGGSGRIRVREEAACPQCGGTGQYQSKMSKSATRCPFCQGAGKTGQDAQRACTRCSGLGVVPCLQCQVPKPTR